MPATCAHSRMVFAKMIRPAITSETLGVQLDVPIARATALRGCGGLGRPDSLRAWKWTYMAAPKDVSVRICRRAALSCNV
jgi:hypothetical protein